MPTFTSTPPSSPLYDGTYTPTATAKTTPSFSIAPSSAATCTLVSGVVRFVGVGSCEIIADAPAGGVYASASGNETLSVGKATLTITASSGTVPEGSALPAITAHETGFVNGDGPSALSTAPTCTTLATATSAPGDYATSCSGAAAADYAIRYVQGTLTVTSVTTPPHAPTPAPSSISLSSSANPARLGAAVTFVAAVSGASTAGPSQGTVSFADGAKLLGTAPLSASGTATLTTTGLPAGAQVIWAFYSGDATTAPSSSAYLLEQIDVASTPVAAHPPAPLPRPSSGTASTASSHPRIGRPLVLKDTFGASTPPAGRLALVARYLWHGHVIEAHLNLVVAPSPTTVTASYAPAPHERARYRAHVSARGAHLGPPRGVVTFVSGTRTLCRSTLHHDVTSCSGRAPGSVVRVRYRPGRDYMAPTRPPTARRA